MPKRNDDRFTAGDYFKAFAALQEEGKGIHPNQIVLLKAHFNAPNHTATAARLAEAVPYKNYGGTNLQYGRLGQRVGAKLGISKPPKGCWVYVLEDDAGRDTESGDLTFTLRRPVIQALTRLGIFRKVKRKKSLAR